MRTRAKIFTELLKNSTARDYRMLEKLVIKFVINFVLNQIAKLGGVLDFPKLKKDLDEKVREFVPGVWFDDQAVGILNKLLDVLEHVLGDKDNQKVILELLAAQKYNEAFLKLQELVLGQFHPKDELGLLVAAL